MIAHVELFPWNDNFETGIEEIDAQHRQLVHLINQLAVRAAAQSGEVSLEDSFGRLAAYVEEHFRTEELIMAGHLQGDEGAAEHRRAHHEFEAQIAALHGRLGSAAQDELIEETLSFLTHWLAFHILDTDRRMAKEILALRAGMSMDAAKAHAEEQMSGAARVLIDTVLAMYDNLSARTLQLMKEIALRQKAERRLQLAGRAIGNASEAIFITDAEGVLVDVNPAFCRMVECDAPRAHGQNIRAFFPSLHEQVGPWSAQDGRSSWNGEIRYQNARGERSVEWLSLSAICDDQGHPAHFVGVFSNVAELFEQRQSLQYFATHDVLTGLPNRALLRDRIAQELKACARSGEALAVVFIDLDGFKAINDAHGHEAGDALLIEAAKRFRACLRATDTVARLGGDEFVVLLPGLEGGEASGEATLARLLDTMRAPVVFEGHALAVTLSMGVALAPHHATEADRLVELADHAMYVAKRSGKNACHVLS